MRDFFFWEKEQTDQYTASKTNRIWIQLWEGIGICAKHPPRNTDFIMQSFGYPEDNSSATMTMPPVCVRLASYPCSNGNTLCTRHYIVHAESKKFFKMCNSLTCHMAIAYRLGSIFVLTPCQPLTSLWPQHTHSLCQGEWDCVLELPFFCCQKEACYGNEWAWGWVSEGQRFNREVPRF